MARRNGSDLFNTSEMKTDEVVLMTTGAGAPEFVDFAGQTKKAREIICDAMAEIMEVKGLNDVDVEEGALYIDDRRGSHAVQQFHYNPKKDEVLVSIEVEASGALEVMVAMDLGTDDLIAAYDHLYYLCFQKEG